MFKGFNVDGYGWFLSYGPGIVVAARASGEDYNGKPGSEPKRAGAPKKVEGWKVKRLKVFRG